MITWDNAQYLCQKLGSDASADSLTFFKLMMNVGYKFSLAELGCEVTQKTKTASTVADQQYYQAPPDFLRPTGVKIEVGNTTYVLREIKSSENWDYMNTTERSGDIPECFFVRPGFGVGGTEIGIYPIPATADNTITVDYEASEKDLSNDEYTTGTVTVTNGSATVTGSGTTFIAAMVGRYFKPTTEGTDEMWYRISARTADTTITLENVYEGTTTAGASYKISEAFNLPEDLQILPVYYAMMHYYSMRKDKDQEAKYKVLFDVGLKQGQVRYAKKTRSALVRRRTPWYGRSYPGHFPESIS